MLSSNKFMQQSLELHLFFARIMKEHSFFLEIGFTPRDSNYKNEADTFRRQFDKLLADAISISDGIISDDILQSDEIITPYTLQAEEASAYFTGIEIATNLTKVEKELMGHSLYRENHTVFEEGVIALNNRAMELTKGLAIFKSRLLSDVLSCKVFTVNYPLLIDHILREAKLYFRLVQRLQNREEIDVERESYEQEVFWNRIMAEHSKFIHGMLDPTEEELMNTAKNFGQQFDVLTREARQAMQQSMPNSKVTDESFKATAEISKFKAEGTKGLVQCKIKSIIIPLLADHTLREANHYLRLLKIFRKSSNGDYE